jgi:hypothetical protein
VALVRVTTLVHPKTIVTGTKTIENGGKTKIKSHAYFVAGYCQRPKGHQAKLVHFFQTIKTKNQPIVYSNWRLI